MFPSSRVTHVVLVAALQNPTVRLRYRAARQALHAVGRPDLHESFLALLGCADVAAGVVRHRWRTCSASPTPKGCGRGPRPRWRSCLPSGRLPR